MSLDLGALTGYLELDESGFDNALQRAVTHLQDFSRRGVVIAGAAGLAIAGAIGSSIVAGMSLEDGRDKLAAELGLSEIDSARVGKIAGQVFAQNYGESMGDVNEAVSSVMTSIEGMADASSRKLQATTIKALNFAKVFDVDVARAAQVAGEAIQYGLADNATDAFDLLVAGSQRVPKALRADLLDAIDEYGPSFKQLGMSGKEAFALLVEGSEQGMYGIDKSGDALKEFTIRATDMSTASQDAYKTLGLSAKDMSNDILAGGDKASAATKKIVDGLLDIDDPATRANTAIALFGTPLEDLGTKNIPAFLKALAGGSDAMDGFGGAANRMDKTLNANAISSLGALKRQAQVAFYAIGNWALPKVNQMASALATNFGPAVFMVVEVLRTLWGALQDTIGFVQSNQTTFIIIAGIITGLLVPAIVAWGVQATVAAAKNVAAWLSAKIGAAQSAAMQVVSLSLLTAHWIRSGVVAMASAGRVAAAWALSKLGVAGTIALYGMAFAMMAAGWIASAAASLAGAATMAAAWFIALGPIGWAIAAVALIVAVVIKYWDQISAFTKAAWDKISGAVMGAVRWVIGFVKENWPLILAIITGPIGLAVLFIYRNMDKIKAAMSNAWNAVKGAARAAWNGVRDIVSNGASAVVGFVRGIPGKLRAMASSWGAAGRSLINAFVSGLKNAGGIISGIAGNVWNAVRGLLNGAIDRLNAALSFTIDPPGPGKVSVNPKDIPHLADGAYVDRPTLALIGEAGPELVQPLSGPKAKKAQQNVFGSGQPSISPLADELAEELRVLIDETRDLQDAMRDVADRPIDLSVNGRQAGRIYNAGERENKR